MVLGYPEYGVRFPPARRGLRPLGQRVWRLRREVDNPKKVEPAIKEALASRPSAARRDVNPDEPPMPGKVAYDQAKKFAKAFLTGQPRKATIATTLFKDKIEQFGR